MSYARVHPDPQSLKKPLFLSLVFHGALFGTMLVSTIYSQRGETWGGAGGAVSVGLVAKLPAIPLPEPQTVTASRTVDTTKGLYKSEPPPKPQPKEDLDSEKIPEFTKEKPRHLINPPSRILEDNTPPPPNAIPYGQGGAPALPYSQFTVGSASQGGVAISGPGGDFAGRFPAYVQGVTNRISSNWLQSTVDPSVRFAPRAVFTFTILRDGTITNIQMTQSSNNRSVDDSALRAIQSSSPAAPLPSGYSGSNVNVEFYFEFHR